MGLTSEQVSVLKGTVHPKMKNKMFVLLPVVLFIHIDCFGVSCLVLGDIDSRDARLLSKYNGTTLDGIQLVLL